ncbi:MAG TPA: XrtA system polysaccharide deacetylase [Steroidobacteraceae bacterium]|jgi:polysaccharide deacetylase family protein (PEP-CTERM system associated)|nr:XrtA system polysaccharide deacetylase [Steroidobacteraceae bacterium]
MIHDHERLAHDRPTNAMSVDVEDYFQVSAFEPVFAGRDWNSIECRIPRNVERILDLFGRHGIQATFFTLGWVAERYPQLVRRIVDSGHEIASHGMQHTRVTQQSREQFQSDVQRTKRLLEDVTGRAVPGYRAASYSIGADNLWALDVLREAGHLYSSSIYPIRHDLYGMPEAPRFAFRTHDNGILEVPVTTVQVGDLRLPCGGGGYFRLFPYAVSRWAMQRVNLTDRQPCVFYFHPWEIDDEQPRVAAPWKSRFRHYLNLSRMYGRLQRLLADFRWGRMDQIFLRHSS